MQNPIIMLLDGIDDIFELIVHTWIFFDIFFVIALIVVICLPNVSFFIFVQDWSDFLVLAPAVAVFEYFDAAAEYFRYAPSVNNFHAFINMCGMLGCIILMFGIPLAFWFMHIMMMFAALYKIVMSPALIDRQIAAQKRGDNDNPIFDRNDFYLMTGRTTVDEIFKAEVDATAIASALKNK